MIHIEDKQNCCGCAACVSVCPKNCISMQQDEEGFLYPSVDKTNCIGCGLCEKVCHELHPYTEQTPLKVIAAINKDATIRLKSSSGGVFHVLAGQTIQQNGVVFGVRFDDNWQAVTTYTETMEGVKAFMGSKYVQARTETAYIDAKRFLEEGRSVLFSGTPCQIAGLKHFLGKDYDNLLAVDIICHGTPSPKVWERYLSEAIKQGQRIDSIEFRNKQNGWKGFSFKLTYNQDDETLSIMSSANNNPFMKAFLSDIILRPACYGCKAKSGRSHSDITIADFWGIQKVFPEMDDDKGTGLVFANTDKGLAALQSDCLSTKQTDYETVKPLNPACYRSPKIHPKRYEFFSRMNSGESVVELTMECTKPTTKQRIYKAYCSSRRLAAKILKTLMGGGKTLSANATENVSLPNDLSLWLSNPQIHSISFRNKQHGWKSYQIEIKLNKTTK